MNTLQVKHGFGRHLPFVVSEVGPITMYTTLSEMQSGIGTYLVKCSVCAFVLRLIQGTHRRLRFTIWTTIAILTVVTLATLLVIGLQCIPLEKVWRPDLPGSCTPKSAQTQLIRVFGGGSTFYSEPSTHADTEEVVGTATDFVCVIIPAFIIRGLQVDRRTKVAMIVIICLGFL